MANTSGINEAWVRNRSAAAGLMFCTIQQDFYLMGNIIILYINTPQRSKWLRKLATETKFLPKIANSPLACYCVFFVFFLKTWLPDIKIGLFVCLFVFT